MKRDHPLQYLESVCGIEGKIMCCMVRCSLTTEHYIRPSREKPPVFPPHSERGCNVGKVGRLDSRTLTAVDRHKRSPSPPAKFEVHRSGKKDVTRGSPAGGTSLWSSVHSGVLAWSKVPFCGEDFRVWGEGVRLSEVREDDYT